MGKRKRLIVIAFLFVVMMSLTACERPWHVHRFMVHSAYDEWLTYIGAFSHKSLSVDGYNEDDGLISIAFDYRNGLKGYKELCDVVNTHNKFVDENPDYFPKDTVIIFTNYVGERITVCFSNNGSRFGDKVDYIEDLNRPYTAKIEYMCVDLMDNYYEQSRSDDIEIDVPVVILEVYSEKYTPSGVSFEFLTEFKKSEQVILKFRKTDYDREKVCKEIKTYLPEVEIYEVVNYDDVRHLEKLQ